jgi:hypothetical protein
MAKLSTTIEAHCIHVATSCENSYVLIPSSNLGDVEVVEEPDLCWSISLICIT